MTSQKTEKQRQSTVIRRDILIELRAVRKQYADSSRLFQLWRSVLEKIDRGSGITRAEIAAAFYPKTYEENYDRALYLARELITHFQTWKRNKSVVLKSLRNKEIGAWVYCNLQKTKDLEKTREHKQNIIEGLIDADKRDMEILRLHPKRRRRLAEILLEEEALVHGYGY